MLQLIFVLVNRGKLNRRKKSEQIKTSTVIKIKWFFMVDIILQEKDSQPSKAYCMIFTSEM